MFLNKEEKIGNYIIKETIGKGTFSKVKLAKHILTNELVAIKILEKSKILDEENIKRIEKEIYYLKKLNHINIITIYEIIENISNYYIVMEYASNGNLFNYIIKNEHLSEKESSYFYFQLLKCIEFIHLNNITHRDIKAENILLTYGEKKIIKLIDFGLSNEYNTSKHKDKLLSTPCGSPCYIAPEIINGEKYNGLYTDIWASGILLFTMICGYLPFDDRNDEILFEKILNNKVEFPSEIKLSKDCKDLILKILNKNPEKRIKLKDIFEHKFIEYGKELYEKNVCEKKFDNENFIMMYMLNNLKIGNSINFIKNNLDNNKHNNITTTFKLLKKKFIEGRFNKNENDNKNNLNNNNNNNNIICKTEYVNNKSINFRDNFNSNDKINNEQNSQSSEPSFINELNSISTEPKIINFQNNNNINNYNYISNNNFNSNEFKKSSISLDMKKNIYNNNLNKKINNNNIRIETSVSIEKKNNIKNNNTINKNIKNYNNKKYNKFNLYKKRNNDIFNNNNSFETSSTNSTNKKTDKNNFINNIKQFNMLINKSKKNNLNYIPIKNKININNNNNKRNISDEKQFNYNIKKLLSKTFKCNSSNRNNTNNKNSKNNSTNKKNFNNNDNNFFINKFFKKNQKIKSNQLNDKSMNNLIIKKLEQTHLKEKKNLKKNFIKSFEKEYNIKLNNNNIAKIKNKEDKSIFLNINSNRIKNIKIPTPLNNNNNNINVIKKNNLKFINKSIEANYEKLISTSRINSNKHSNKKKENNNNNLIIFPKPKNLKQFIMCGTELNFNEIENKIKIFCDENKLILNKENKNKFTINFDKNTLLIEISIMEETNLLKLYHLNGNENETKKIMKQIILLTGL